MNDQANVDARRNLGVRPGARPRGPRPTIQINQSISDSAPRMSLDRPPSPKSHGVSFSVPRRNVSEATAASPITPSVSPSAEGFKRLRRPSLARRHNAAGLTANQGQYETQKLLTHLLDRLEARPPPPDLLDRAAVNARKAVGRLKHKSKGRVTAIGEAVAAAATGRKHSLDVPHSEHAAPDDGEEDAYDSRMQEGEWDTDATYDLVEQVRNILVIADKQGMELFGESQIAAVAAATSPSKDRRRTGRFVTSPLVKNMNDDNQFNTANISGKTLLTRMTQMVRSLLTVDCIHPTTKFRPMKPKYALQAVCMDIAAVLYQMGDLSIQLSMMEAVVDGLYGMGDALREKVCEWLEGRLDDMLRRLARERRLRPEEREKVNWSDPFAESPPASVPTFAFSVHPGDAPPEDETERQKDGWMRFSPVRSKASTLSRRDIHGILSTHSATGNVSPVAMQVAAIVPRILVAITATVDLSTSNLVTIFRVHRLLSLILLAKPDAALDLLEIIALGPVQTRRRGLDILATFYPEAVGHNMIARRPAFATYAAHRNKWETGQERVLGEEDTEGHRYIPWRTSEAMPIKCVTCQQLCTGYCVQCTLCFNVKHVGCLQLFQDEMLQYNLVTPAQGYSEPEKTEIIQVHFSKCIPRLDEMTLNGGPTRGTNESTVRQVGQHVLYLINLFTLTLCAECGEPLWGATAQAYTCMGPCQKFFHPACADAMSGRDDWHCRPGHELYANPNHPPHRRDPFTISATAMRASFERYGPQLYRSPEKLGETTYDEVAVLHANLWTQLEAFKAGLSAGSLRIHYDGDEASEDPVGLASLVMQYQELLDKQTLAASSALAEYTHATGQSVEEGDVLWHPRYLQYCAALLRCPSEPHHQPPPSHPAQAGLLTVDGTPAQSFPDLDPPSVAYEAVEMGTIRQTLSSDLGFRDDLAVSILLKQMARLGLCSVANTRAIDTATVANATATLNFPLPQLMDSSPAVELLVLVIEQLLDDIDLTANEQGLALLFNRAWPTSMCSPYALERLGGEVMSWIMAEDDILHHIVKNYASKRKRLPGVRNTPSNAAKGIASVATYKEDRTLLLRRYVRPWLRALHDHDPMLYAELAYERSKIIDDRWGVVEVARGDKAGSQVAGMALERIAALADAGVTFSTTLDLLTAWLEDIGGLAQEDIAYRSLPRLLRHTNTECNDSADLWALANQTSQEDGDGLQRVCRWLRVLACSGVEVPWESITALIRVDLLSRASDAARYDLVTAINANTTPIAPDAFAEMANDVFTKLVSSLDDRGFADDQPGDKGLSMLRTSMRTLLRAYEANPEDVAHSSLGAEKTPRQVASHGKRKHAMPVRISLIPLDVGTVCAAAKLLHRVEYPPEMTLDFLWLLLKGAAVENADGFVHQLCGELYKAVWPLYDHSVDRRSRARLFLKLLTINPGPIERIVAEDAETLGLHVVRERLVTFILELADDRVTSQVSNWRRASVGLILQLFNTVMSPTDPSPDNLVVWKAFLPSHLKAVSSCFEDYLEFCSDEQRLAMLSQLLNLQTLLPSWALLGWHAMEQIVSEQVTTIQRFEKADTVMAMAAVDEAWTIRASVLSLGLNMLAAGVPCEWRILQRFQQHVAAACDQPWPTPCDSITNILLPSLKNVLDSAHRVSLSQKNEDSDREKTALVGSLFVSVVIHFATDLAKWDFMVQRYLLDILFVVFFKHNVQSAELQALYALRMVATYVAESSNTENGILALQVLRTAQAQMSKDRFGRIAPLLFVFIAEIMAKSSADGDSAFIETCRAFLQESVSKYGSSGLLLQVLREEASNPSKDRAPDTVGDAVRLASADLMDEKVKREWFEQLFRDLPDILRRGRDQMNAVLVVLGHFISTLEDPLSDESAQEYGIFLSRLGKTVTEWDESDDFDPNPVLRTSAAMLKLVPSASAPTLLHQVSTFLHLALSRCSVNLEDIETLVPVSIDVARRHGVENTVVTVLFELCGAVTTGQEVTGVTLHTLLAFMSKDTDGSQPLDKERQGILVDASYGCMDVLRRTHPTMAVLRDAEMTLRIVGAASAILVGAEVVAPGTCGTALMSVPSEAAMTQLDVFTHLLCATVDKNLGAARANIVSLFPILSRATALSMFACADLLNVPDPGGDGPQLAGAAFMVMRLAVIAASDPGEDATPAAQEALLSFWRRLWPEWDRLLSLSISPTCANPTLRAVTLSVLLDIVIFVSNFSPLLLIDTAALVDRGLRALEEWYVHSNTTSAKLPRAITALEGAVKSKKAHGEMSRPAAIAAVRTDMLATERLRVAAARMFDSAREREREKEREHRTPGRMPFLG